MTTALVTGVSGIGAGYVRLHLEKKNKVFAVDRLQSALDALPVEDNLIKILADVGTKEGLLKIGQAVGDTPINHVLLAAAVAPNDGTGKASPNFGLANLTFDLVDDAIRTEVHGKIFLVKTILPNLIAGFKAAGKKSRVMNIGAPFGDKPKPDGKMMAIPGWMTIGIAKAATKYAWDSLQLEMSRDPASDEAIVLGYGHPGLTETSITRDAVAFYPKAYPLQKMCEKRLSSGDVHTSDEAASLFNAVMEQVGDEEFAKETWNIVKMFGMNFDGVDVKKTSDVASGIELPVPKSEMITKEGRGLTAA